ncbi:unnamed protein product [Phyllotreta striolata]|uniref:Gamma-aminobutyric acid receptor subunit beta-like n=1 Tax=Phyllotreta striolata TaxID=444603 RepID=A0A9N9XL50_PHYSR|nr:unnamed protein product [Phyllotreta striolata]
MKNSSEQIRKIEDELDLLPLKKDIYEFFSNAQKTKSANLREILLIYLKITGVLNWLNKRNVSPGSSGKAPEQGAGKIVENTSRVFINLLHNLGKSVRELKITNVELNSSDKKAIVKEAQNFLAGSLTNATSFKIFLKPKKKSRKLRFLETQKIVYPPDPPPPVSSNPFKTGHFNTEVSMTEFEMSDEKPSQQRTKMQNKLKTMEIRHFRKGRPAPQQQMAQHELKLQQQMNGASSPRLSEIIHNVKKAQQHVSYKNQQKNNNAAYCKILRALHFFEDKNSFRMLEKNFVVSDRLANVTQTISKLLEGYDIRLRPNFGGEPLFVGMDLTIASFDAISEVNMDYTITLYLNQYWKDERLAFGGDDEILTLSGDFAEKIWVPDTFFANDKNSFLHDVTERNKLVRLSGDGFIVYGMRFTTTLACMMDLHYYPLDSQNCTVEIESYGYTVVDVVMYWKSTPVRGVEEAELPQFTIMGWETNDRKERLATGTYQRLSLSFKLQRNIGYFIFQTYLPSILIVMLSWVSFWINHEATSARVALGITTVLTMTTISTGVRSSLPRISYVKAIDIYLVMCFVFVFAALLEYAAVNYTYWGARAKKKSKKLKESDDSKIGTKVTTQSSVSNQDIIELKDVKMSPIASIRNRYSSGYAYDVDPSKFPPSFRILRTQSPYNYRSPSGVRYRGNKGNPVHKPKMLQAIRKGALVLKSSLPKIKDVNVIDKYSRIVFPVAFLAFNIGYWLFYFLE